MVTSDDERLVTVCAECLMACCWQAVFYCARARGAGTTQKTVKELRELDREHPDYWKPDANMRSPW